MIPPRSLDDSCRGPVPGLGMKLKKQSEHLLDNLYE